MTKNLTIPKTLIKKLYWDRNIDPEYPIHLLNGGEERIHGDLGDLYRRLLNSCDWYTLLSIFPLKTIKKELLTEQIVTRLFPKELRKRYRYARQILSE